MTHRFHDLVRAAPQNYQDRRLRVLVLPYQQVQDTIHTTTSSTYDMLLRLWDRDRTSFTPTAPFRLFLSRSFSIAGGPVKPL